MVRNAEQTASNAEQTTTNKPGMCLQWSRERATIASLYPDAATAWANAKNRHHGDRNPPRGAMVYWTGGASGYGHIAVALGNGKVRSTDSGGSGKPATVDIGWPEAHWGLPYAGWADNVNNVQIPGVGGSGKDDDDMPYTDWPKKDRDALANDVAARVWQFALQSTDPAGRHAGNALGSVWNGVQRLLKKTGA